MFLATLAEAVGKTGWLVHGYVLMGNHYHLLIETPQANLVRGMGWVQTTYTTRYNARHRGTGHLFAGRYKAIVVDAEDSRYLATLLDYLHLNPVRAGLIRPAQGEVVLDYPWSSLPGYAWRKRQPHWLAVTRGLGCLGWGDTASDRRAFVERVEARACAEAAEQCGCGELAGQSLQSTLRRGWYYGREAFREWLLNQAAAVLQTRHASGQNYHGEEMRDHGLATAQQLISAGLAEHGLSVEDLPCLRRSDARKAAIAQAVRRQTTAPLAWIARQLQMGTPMNVSRLTQAR